MTYIEVTLRLFTNEANMKSHLRAMLIGVVLATSTQAW